MKEVGYKYILHRIKYKNNILRLKYNISMDFAFRISYLEPNI